MALASGYLQLPGGGGAAADGGGGAPVLVGDAALKTECGVAALRQRTHRGARGGDRLAGVFFVAAEQDGNRGTLERTGTLQGMQGGDHDHVAAFHVGHALAADAAVFLFPHRHRAAGLEHGVEVAQQQQALAFARCARAGGQQVAGTAHRRRHVDPAGLEAERIEMSAEQLPNLAHAFRVHRAAVDQHALPEQVQRLRRMRPDFGHDALLDRVQGLGRHRCRLCTAGQRRHGKQPAHRPAHRALS
jgi:hypothetical protein